MIIKEHKQGLPLASKLLVGVFLGVILAGIVTDGDLRRHMRPDLMTATVDEVMTKRPKTISPNLLAGEALELLNSSKITALLVTEGKKPVGIVHLHDLLRAGVA